MSQKIFHGFAATMLISVYISIAAALPAPAHAARCDLAEDFNFDGQSVPLKFSYNRKESSINPTEKSYSGTSIRAYATVTNIDAKRILKATGLEYLYVPDRDIGILFDVTDTIAEYQSKQCRGRTSQRFRQHVSLLLLGRDPDGFANLVTITGMTDTPTRVSKRFAHGAKISTAIQYESVADGNALTRHLASVKDQTGGYEVSFSVDLPQTNLATNQTIDLMEKKVRIYQPGLGIVYCHPNRLKHAVKDQPDLVSIETPAGDGVIRYPHLKGDNGQPLEIQLLMDTPSTAGVKRIATRLGEIYHNNELWCELQSFKNTGSD